MRKLPVAEIVVALAVFAAGAAVYVYSHRDEPAIERTKTAGDEIVAALERHRAQEGSYPPSLAALVPAYLERVPAPPWGEQWTYRTFEDGAYCGLYVRQGAMTLHYDFPGHRWALDRL
jgi:hypothetical protein